jgi:hypothetical protein
MLRVTSATTDVTICCLGGMIFEGSVLLLLR